MGQSAAQSRQDTQISAGLRKELRDENISLRERMSKMDGQFEELRKENAAVLQENYKLISENARLRLQIDGLTYEEIATVMSCPIGTVRSRIFRAREVISAKVKPLLENQTGKRW